MGNPPIDILEIAMDRADEAYKRYRHVMFYSTSAVTTSMIDVAFHNLGNARGDLSKALRLRDALRDA